MSDLPPEASAAAPASWRTNSSLSVASFLAPYAPHELSMAGRSSRSAPGSTRWPYTTEASSIAWLSGWRGGGSHTVGGHRSVTDS